VDARDEDERRAADDVEDRRDDPELRELDLRDVPPREPRDRDEEVLGEELRAADDEEDEGDPESERAQRMGRLLADAGRERGRDRGERDDAEDDVEAGDERRRGELEPRALQAPPALLARAREDLVWLWGRRDLGGDATPLPARRVH
jgi:hypothetical protein